jgi:hypothetical protein
MAILARLADGRTLKFPDGTDPAVVQATVKRVLGVSPMQEAPTQEAPVDQNQGGIADLFTSFKQSALGSTKALTDVVGAGNVASEYLGKLSAKEQQKLSPARQRELQRQAKRMTAAEESGSLFEELKAGAMDIAEAPAISAAQALGSFVPYVPAILGGKVAAMLGLGAKGVATIISFAPRIMAAMSTAQGVGAVKGSIYEAVYEAAKADGLDDAAAKQKAVGAQNYLGDDLQSMGKNLGSIVAGGGLGFIAGRGGAEKLLAPGKRAAVKTGQEIGKEIATEGAQGGQERSAANLALQKEGKDVPTLQGVVGQATREGLTGGLGAGTVSLIKGSPTAEAPKPPAAPPETPTAPPQVPAGPTAPDAPLQGALFSAEEMAGFGGTEPIKVPKQTKAARPVKPTQDQQSLDLEDTRSYETLVLASERLKALPEEEKTPEIRARIKELDTSASQVLLRDIRKTRQDERDAKNAQAKAEKDDRTGRRKFPAIANAQPDLFGDVLPEAAPATETEVEAGPTSTPVNQNVRAGWPGWQYSLGLRGGRADPTMTMEALGEVGIPLGTSKKWFETNVVGKTRAGIQQLVDADPTLAKGPSARAKILRELLAPEPAAFTGEGRATTATGGRSAGSSVSPDSVPDTGSDQSGVGPIDDADVESGDGGADAGTGETDQAGLGDTGGDTGTGDRGGLGDTGRESAPLGQLELPGVPPAQAGPVQGQNLAPEPEDPTLMEAIKAKMPTYQLPLMYEQDTTPTGEKKPSGGETNRDRAPEPRAIQRIRAAESKPQLEVAMDEIVDIQRDLANPDREQVMDFLEWGLTNIPNFEVALRQAETRRRAKDKVAIADLKSTQRESEAKKQAIEDAETAKRADERAKAIDAAAVAKAQAEAEKAQAEAEKAKAEAEKAKAEVTVSRMQKPQSARTNAPEAEPEVTAEATVGDDEVEIADTVELPEPDALKLVEQINGKSMLEVAQLMARTLPKGYQRVIAQRVAVMLRRLEGMGANFQPVRVTPEGQRLISAGVSGTTMTETKQGVITLVRITLNHPSNGDLSGVTPETILHELVHAALVAVVNFGRMRGAANTDLGKKAKELSKLFDAVVLHLNAKIDTGETLTPFEQAIVDRNGNMLKNTHELLTWGLTNSEMQAFLESIPFKQTTLWNQFVTKMRDLLGIPASADTALSELLRVSDSLFSTTTEEITDATTAVYGAPQTTSTPQITRAEVMQSFQQNYTADDVIESMGPLDPNEKKGLFGLFKGASKAADQLDPSRTTKFRTLVADTAATVEGRLSKQFDGAVRDALGKLNPMGLFRQAQDHTKLLYAFFKQGSLVKDKQTGMWQVQSKKGVRAPLAVFELIDKFAEKNKLTRKEATKKAHGVLIGKRSDELRKSNAKNGTTFKLSFKGTPAEIDAQIDALLAEYNSDPIYAEMNKAMDEARIALVDSMVAVGRLTPEMGQEWKDVVGYVPFDRIDVLGEKFTQVKKTSTKGLAQLGKLPEFVGTDMLPIGNVFENYLNTLGWMVGQVVRSDANVTTLRALEDAGFATAPKRTAYGMKNPVGGYVKGEMMYWDLPSKYDVMAFKDLNPQLPKWLQGMRWFADKLRTGVTALPPFALKQLTDDIQRAWMTSGVVDPIGLARSSVINFVKFSAYEIAGIAMPRLQTPEIEQMSALGLTGELDFSNGRPAESVMADLGYKPRGVFANVLRRLEGITRASDLAVRKAILDHTLRETGDQLLAQTRAREFINFRRRGASDFVGAAIATVPFFNAYVQGMDVLYRSAFGKNASSSIARKQALQMFWSRAMIATTLSTLYAMGKDDEDEDYKNMDLRIRDSNWIFPGGYKLSVPTELGAIFKVIPERVVEYMRRQGTPEEQEAFEATRTALAYMFEQYLGRAVPIPQAVKPLAEAWFNFSFLTGRQLIGTYQKNQDASRQRAFNTSELAIAIADFSRDMVGVEVSPILIDNAVRGYLGSMGTMFLMTTDALINPDRIDRPLHKVALLSNYLYDPVGSRAMSEFYDLREQAVSAGNTLRNLAQRDLEAAGKYANEHQDELMMESTVNATLKQLSDTRAYRNYLNSNAAALNGMTQEDRKAAMEKVRRYELQLVSWVRDAKLEMARVRKATAAKP